MSTTWEEVLTAEKEKRRELVLQGAPISERIDKNGLDPSVFKLVHLNYLEISGTTLSTLDARVGSLVNMTSLLLCNNKISEIPVEIEMLTKLKILNLSNNKIKSVPEELCSLPELYTLNLSLNEIEEIPSINRLKSLHIFNVSNNKLSNLPEGIYDSNLVHLSQILAADNEIVELSSDIEDLPHLNTLDLSSNKLTEVPLQLCICPKLKELDLKGNKFKDRRFGKLVEQCAFKSIIDYLQTLWKKENQKAGKDKDKKKRKKKSKKSDDDVEEVIKNMVSVLRFWQDSSVVVEVKQQVQAVRPYIVCCLVRGLDLTSKFKSFITLQTKLHDTVCQKRQVATIATHEFRGLKVPLRYDAKHPQLLKIVPLGRQKEVSGEKLFENLRNEAEEQRKEKKRNTFSGIHKYLDLLADKSHYPCLTDADGFVLSFPPITNSDKTKISKDTKDILVEVTSSTSLETCKRVMDELLFKMLELGLGSSQQDKPAGGATAAGGKPDSESDEGVVFEGDSGTKPTHEKLVVEQVKVVDHEGTLKVLYPSRTDLNNDQIEVIRNFD